MRLNQREQMMRNVQIAGFGVDELNLYLDTHHDDAQALACMQEYTAKLKKATEEYEAIYGPLTVESADSCGKWRWICRPWPWEREG